MGHTRLGPIPKHRRWAQLVEFLGLGATPPPPTSRLSPDRVQELAGLALHAAQPALVRAADDKGLLECLYVLAALPAAAREETAAPETTLLGLTIGSTTPVLDILTGVQTLVDQRIAESGGTTDTGEIAQRALGEALSSALASRVGGLFAPADTDVRQALRQLSTTAGFADLGQRFFGNFLARFLNSYLSRMVATATGTDTAPHVGVATALNTALREHGQQSARIVHDFSGEWYSKTNWREGITRDNVRRFLHVALKKLSAELHQQEGGS